MSEGDSSINSLSERFDPAAALIQALETIEQLTTQIDGLLDAQNRLEDTQNQLMATQNQLISDKKTLIAAQEKLLSRVEELESDLEEHKQQNSDAHWKLMEKYYSLVPESDLQSNRAELLISLLSTRGQMRQKKAAELMGVSEYVMSRLVKKLSTDVGTMEDPSDRNFNLIYLRRQPIRRVAATPATPSQKTKSR